MTKITFILGAIFSKLINYPSKYFAIILAVVLMLVAAILGSSFSPLMQAIPGFLNSWYQFGTFENFPQYLVLASYSLLIFAAISQVSIASFDLACDVKQKYDIRILQW